MTRTEGSSIVGENLDAIRKARGWSKTELSKRTGYCYTNTVMHIKTGCLSREAITRYMEVLGCTADDLLAGTVDRAKFNPLVELKDFYPYNLAVAAYGDESVVDKVNADALYKAVAELPERVQKVIACRYKAHMTLEETGKCFGVTRERIRQLEQKGLRLLRHPRIKFICDVEKIIKAKEEAEKERDRLKLENIELRDRLKISPTEWIEKVVDPDIPIADMELSVRSYNALLRAGYKYVSDLDGIAMSDLMKIRYLGRKSALEIVSRLNEYGIEVK